MPVIINEFEVVSQAPPLRQDEEAASQPQAAPVAPTPHDILAILQHSAERLVRLQAD